MADESLSDLHRSSENENRLRVEFEKPGFDFGPIRENEGLINIEDEGENGYLIRTQRELDIRKNLFEESVRQENPIYLLMKVELSLEDIFRNLTN